MENKNLDIQKVISGLPLFQGLDAQHLDFLVRSGQLKTLKRHATVYLPDEDSNEVFFLLKGEVKIASFSDEGREVIKSLIHPESIFGELGLVGERKRQNVAKALKTDVLLLVFPLSALQELMRKSHVFGERIMTFFGERVIRAEEKLESLIFKDARTRIIDFIRRAVRERGRAVGFEMLLRHSLTHQDIANITCTSRQTVTLVLNELRKSNLIYFNRGKILVRDMAKLA